MFSRFKKFLSTHKQKLIIGGAFVGGVFLLSKYAQNIIREWQERETKELLERARKQQHYESIERTCNQTALTMAPNLRDTVNKLLRTEELIQQLKIGAPNKVLIWENLKILAFTKLAALVYASSILIVTLRIQLNLIGGYMFCDTAKDSEEIKVTSAIQEKYLGLCQFFMEDGTKRLCSFIEEKVKLVLQDKSLKEKLTLHDIEQLFWTIQTSISNDLRDPCKSLASYILPSYINKDLYGPNVSVIDNIFVETNDLLESEEVHNLIGSCISCGFSFVTDQIAEFYKEKNNSSQSKSVSLSPNTVPTTSSTPDVLISSNMSDNLLNFGTIAIPMAKVIPIINGMVLSHSNKEDVSHTWIQQLIFMDSIKALGANIYETFSSKK